MTGKRSGQKIRSRNRILNREIDSYSSSRRHGMSRVSNAQQARPPPSLKPVDLDRQNPNLLPIMQLVYALSQAGRNAGNIGAQRIQTASP
jgi:hypothetical protein